MRFVLKFTLIEAVSGMALPPLGEFIQPIPAAVIAHNPGRWLEACLIHGVDSVVLVDENGTPVRALSLNQLLSSVDTSSGLWRLADRGPAAGEVVPPRQNVLNPPNSIELGIISATIDAVAAVQMVAAAPDRCWVVVDDQQRYQGLLDKPRLLAAAVTQREADTTGPADPLPPSGDAIASKLRTSRSNTALLTYLGHELKTPLTSLLGLSSLLKIGGLGDLSPRQNRYIGLIQQHCRRLANWVNTLIDLGRIEGGTLKLIPQLVDLTDIWRNAYHQAILRTGHEEAPPVTLPPLLKTDQAIRLVADPNRLQQMLSCLMQTALVAQHDSESTDFPLTIDVWDDWITFAIVGIEQSLSLVEFSQTAFSLPFPATPMPSAHISAEMGDWLEWLLMRKLAQYHRGELVFVVHEGAKIYPTLILPQRQLAISESMSRLLLVVAPLDVDSLATLWYQAHQLNYRLLITPHVHDAIEIAAYLPLSAVLFFIHPEANEAVEELRTLKTALTKTGCLTAALVPPSRSALLGRLPVERELLWPTDRLGSVLLQPPQVMPVPHRLTILYLRGAEPVKNSSQKFPSIFHDFGCRVLEVDDLEQASLLRRVWKPNIAVLDPEIAMPAHYLDNLGTFPELSSLPLITLTMAATQAAHARPDLSVFPCLVEEAAWDTPEAIERLTTWLIQVLQVAATPPC